jgi:hypothetical protein
MNDLSPPNARAEDHADSGTEGLASGTREAPRRIPTGVRGLLAHPGPATSDAQALRIAIRQLTDDELKHETKVMRRRAHFAQGMADRMDSEIRRRKRQNQEQPNERKGD